MTELYLIRHGVTEYNIQHRMHGHADTKLAPEGLRQLPWLVDYCAGLGIQSLFSSPLLRARQTAAAISERLQLPVVIHDGLIERAVGPLEGIMLSEIQRYVPDYVSLQMKLYPGRLDYPGVERPEEIQHRIYSAVLEIAQSQEGKTICIVTHEMVLNMLLAKIWKVPDMFQYRRMDLPNSSVTKLEFSAAEGFRCAFYGKDDFIPEDMRRSLFAR